MASLFTRVSKTPVKILRASADDCCRICNVHFPTYGCIGRFNLFKGKNSRERNVAGLLSLVLGFPVNKESGISSVICIKSKGTGICGGASEEVPQKFPNHEESCEESACKEIGYTIAFPRKTKTDFKTVKCLQLFSGATIPRGDSYPRKTYEDNIYYRGEKL